MDAWYRSHNQEPMIPRSLSRYVLKPIGALWGASTYTTGLNQQNQNTREDSQTASGNTIALATKTLDFINDIN